MTNPIQSSLNENMSDTSTEKGMVFVSPIDGDMLSLYDGTLSRSSLAIIVRITASTNRKLEMNGIRTRYEDGFHQAEIPLKDYRNVIEVTDTGSGEKNSITVFWLKNVVNKYRLSIDDNIWFLKDIALNRDKYKSIFENPYLSFLKEVHDTYGTKIHLNLFYQTEGFNLSQMTDKYKNEWKENAGWLRLSFHSLQEFPDRPYIHAGYDEVLKDCKKTMEQIRRFAGDELLGPVMTLHWGEATKEGCRALSDSGYRILAGYFSLDSPDTVSYYLDDEKRKHVNNRFLWCDTREGIIFSRMALVINTLKLEQILPYLNDLRSDSHKPAYVDLMIHEQYFHSSYEAYQPDFREKILTSVKWAADNGYQPAFLSECVLS
jgi:hypothetical protein